MRFFTIAFYTIKQSLRDYGLLLKMLLLPLVAIFILGQALNTAFIPGGLQPTRVAVFWQGAEEDRLLEIYLNDAIAQAIVTDMAVESVSEGISFVESGKVNAFLYITGSNLYIYGDANNAYRTSIIDYLSTTFALVPIITSEVETEYLLENFIPLDDLPRAIDYYGVTMLVMILFFGSVYGNRMIAHDFLSPVDLRRRATSVPSWQWYAGKAIGLVGVVVIQGLIIVGFTALVYGVNWGSQLWLVGLIIVLVAILSVALGMLISMVLGDGELALKTLNLLVPFNTFLAGGYVVLNRVDPVLQKIQYLSPNYWVQTALFNAIYGGVGKETNLILLGLFLMILVTFSSIAMMGKKEYQ